MSKKITTLILFLIMAILLIGCGEEKKYEEAQKLASQKQYKEAIDILTEISDYEDSSDLIQSYQAYLDAKVTFENGNILEYINIIDENGLEVDENYKEDILNEAIKESSKGNLEVAIILLSNIGDYKYSNELLEVCRENIIYCGLWESLSCKMYYKFESADTGARDTVELCVKISGIDEITYIANGYTVKNENGVLKWTVDGNEWIFYLNKALVERFIGKDFFYATYLQSPKTYACYAYNEEATDSQANALMLAKQYLDTMPFSYNGLIEQLKYEGISDADAKYAVDMCGANWNEEAQKMANQYLEIFDMKAKEVFEQLVHEGFTYQQAAYGRDVLKKND